MALQLDALERHGELVPDQGRYSSEVRAELLAMSSATIDRYLRGAKARDQITGKSASSASVAGARSICRYLTSGIAASKASASTAATLKGEFARTLNLTEYPHRLGFMQVRRHAHKTSSRHPKEADQWTNKSLLIQDNGLQPPNKAVIKWAAQMEIFFTRSRPYKKNDQAAIQLKRPPCTKDAFTTYDNDENVGAQPTRKLGDDPAQPPGPHHQLDMLGHRTRWTPGRRRRAEYPASAGCWNSCTLLLRTSCLTHCAARSGADRTGHSLDGRLPCRSRLPRTVRTSCLLSSLVPRRCQIREDPSEQGRQLTQFRGHSLRDAWIRFRGILT